MEKLEGDDIRLTTMPFVRFLIAFAGGIIMAYWCEAHIYVYRILCVIAILSIILFALGIWKTKLQSHRSYISLSILFYIFLFTFAWVRTWQPDPKIQADHFSHNKSDALIGFILDEPKITAKTIRFPMQVIQTVLDSQIHARSGKLLVSIQRDTLNDNTKIYNYGDQLIIDADYDTINPSYNPNEFDYRKYMISQSIWHQSYLEADQLMKISESEGTDLIHIALDLRKKMVAKLARLFDSHSIQAIISTLVLGYRSELDRDLLNTFSVTGTIHVLSVSGLHVGIIFSVFSFLLLWKKRSNWMWLKAILLILLIWMYALITGLSPSVLRASIMLSLGIVALSIVRRTNIYNTIAFSAFILLLYNPRFIVDIGFQLSYLSVLGIVYFYPKINLLVGSKNPILSALWSYVSISLAAQLATFPLVTYYFYFFPVYFLPANLFILLPAAMILYLGILVLIIPEGLVSYGLSWLLEKIVYIMTEVLVYFEGLPYSSLNLIWNKPWHVLLLYIIILGWMSFAFYKTKKAIYVVYVAFIILGIDWSINKIRTVYKDQITIYNVGKNTAIGIFAQGKTYLYTNFADEANQTFQYSVKPNFSALGKTPMFINPSGAHMQSELMILDNFIQVRDKSLFVYDRNLVLQGSIAVDILYVKNHALPNLTECISNIQFDMLLLDASNAWWYIKKIEKEAEKIGIPVYVLKDNFAYVW